MKEDKKTRIRQERISLDQNKIKDFFDGRAKKELYHRYNKVNFQDHHPELALERDRLEKDQIQKYMKFRPDDIILDIGCGVGRWGDTIVPLLKNGRYIGVDYSESLLDIAKEQFAGEEHTVFICGAFQTIEETLNRAGINKKFDKILINGVLMYMNDDDLNLCLDSINRLLAVGGFLYIKEAIAVNERLTLNQFFSDDLESDYSAIYRPIYDCTQILFRHYIDNGYSIISSGPSWGGSFDENQETYHAYWILRRER